MAESLARPSAAQIQGVTRDRLVPLERQMAAQAVTRDMASATPNERDLLTLLTVKQLQSGSDVWNKAIDNQLRYLQYATALLQSDLDKIPTPAAKQAALNLQQLYGQDFKGSVDLAEVLKAKAKAKKEEAMFEPFVQDALRMEQVHNMSAAQRSGFQMTKPTGGTDSGSYGSDASGLINAAGAYYT